MLRAFCEHVNSIMSLLCLVIVNFLHFFEQKLCLEVMEERKSAIVRNQQPPGVDGVVRIPHVLGAARSS